MFVVKSLRDLALACVYISQRVGEIRQVKFASWVTHEVCQEDMRHHSSIIHQWIFDSYLCDC